MLVINNSEILPVKDIGAKVREFANFSSFIKAHALRVWVLNSNLY